MTTGSLGISGISLAYRLAAANPRDLSLRHVESKKTRGTKSATPDISQRPASCLRRPHRATRGGEGGARRRFARHLCRGQGKRLRREGAPNGGPPAQTGRDQEAGGR